MDCTEPEPKKPVLLVAAESIALATGMVETVADVLRDRALRHYGEGLRQYLSIRLGSHGAGEHAFAELARRAADLSSATLAAAPGPRAHLYKLARDLVAQRRARVSRPSGELAWLEPKEQAPESYLAALARLRRELPSEDAELLELRYARELAPSELAYVIGRDTADLISMLEDAAQRAADFLGDAPPSRLGGLRGALQEAFALSKLPAAEPPGRSPRTRRGLPLGTLIGERYAIEQRVGEGSFGDVYRALDADVPGHVVALKILHKPATSEEARKTALRELRLIASVFHPSVVNFKDHGWYEDRLWFVMPWYEGETLEERIQRAPLSREEALEIFVPLAQALATMHASGIRHQDIKPDNIFLARIGEAYGERQRILPVLIDLGVAAKEAEMIVAGTPLYFAPEIAAQYAGKDERPPISSKADVFSLALSLRNALEPETQEQVPGTAVEAFIAHRADHPPGGPEDRELQFLEPWFKRWLAREPDARPSAEEFAEELNELTRPERRRERRRAVMRWAMPIALGSLLGLSSITYVYLKEREEAHQARLRAEVSEHKLDKESARRLQLEESYQVSELTRQQLEDRVRLRDADVSRLGAQLRRSKQESAELVGRLQGLASELEAAKRAREAEQARASVAEGKLFSAEQRRAFLESELREARTRMSAAEGELDELRVRARTLLAELDRARNETHTQIGRASSLERALMAARAEQARIQEELEDQRRRVRDLERGAEARGQSAADAEAPTQVF